MSDFEDYFIAAQYDVLTEREIEIVHLRFGLSGLNPKTLQEVAAYYDLSRERIRQILNKATVKIRSRGLREISKGQVERPCAQFIQYTQERIQSYGTHEPEAVLALLDEELPYLPTSTHGIPLIVAFISPTTAEMKSKLHAFRQANDRRQKDQKQAEWQIDQLSAMLEHVIWFPTIKTWRLEQFKGMNPKRIARLDPEGNSGSFESRKLGRAVNYMSSSEHQYLLRLENIDEVIYYLEQPFSLEYEYDGKKHSYCPDVFLLLADGRGIVVEIKPVFHMALQINLAKWRALKEFCAVKGFGLIVTDGRKYIQQIQRHPVRSEIVELILKRLEKGALEWAEYDNIRKQNQITSAEFLALVLKYRLDWRLGSFSLSLAKAQL